VINAIHDAAGIWIKDIPAKPEKVFWALKEKERKEKERKEKERKEKERKEKERREK